MLQPCEPTLPAILSEEIGRPVARGHSALRRYLRTGFATAVCLIMPMALPATVSCAIPPTGAFPIPATTVRRRESRWISFAAPSRQVLSGPMTLWATFYRVHEATAIAQGTPLLTPGGDRLGPRLSQRDWCQAALQGTVQVKSRSGTTTTYNFAGRGDRPQVNCAPFFAALSAATVQQVERVRFAATAAP
jgi:hypothetical protein